MADYIVGIAPLRMKFWIEYERMQAQARQDAKRGQDGEWIGYDPTDTDCAEDYDFLSWCATCDKKETKLNPAAEVTVRFQVRCWCDRAEVSIKSRGGCPDELPWLVAARDMEHEKLEFHGATNGVWDGDEKTGFAKFREMFSGDK